MTDIDLNIVHGAESTDFEQKLGNLGDFILSKLDEFNDEISLVSFFLMNEKKNKNILTGLYLYTDKWSHWSRNNLHRIKKNHCNCS